ncbi:MerF [hydrothermal vent metagenome]|uniref:MerF n=1 Tax=hydrothermal vent metagenome TaxID=652676 RepID=A0A3B1CV19_9ZZZZ
MENKPSNKLLKFGIGGTIIAALCCFTPILVIVLGAVGLSVMVAYLDIVLLPALFIFIGVTVYALSKRKQEDCCATNNSPDKGETGNDMKQESCCSPWPESKDLKFSTCPDNKKKGQSVDPETLRNLIKKERGHEIKDTGYYFCKAPDCDTVYFHPKSGQTFEKSDIKVRVGLKETDDPVWVCYCFDISKRMIAEEIENTGLSASGDRIRKEVADKNCECEIKNPSGRCCLGEVLAAEKAAQKNRQNV